MRSPAIWLHPGRFQMHLWELPQTQGSLKSVQKLQILHLDTCPEPETCHIENYEIVNYRILPHNELQWNISFPFCDITLQWDISFPLCDITL